MADIVNRENVSTTLQLQYAYEGKSKTATVSNVNGNVPNETMHSFANRFFKAYKAAANNNRLTAARLVSKDNLVKQPS